MSSLRYVVPLVVAATAAGALWVRTTPQVRPAMNDPAALATYGDLELESAEGPLRLSDFRGEGVVVYFGYTSCPDICPTTLQTMGAAFDLLEPEEQGQMTLLFVSVDPERDDPIRLRDYVRFFHERFHGGSASPDAVARMAADWGVQFRKVDSPGSAMGYTVDHSTEAFLVDKRGRVVRRIPHGTPALEVAELLRSVL